MEGGLLPRTNNSGYYEEPQPHLSGWRDAPCPPARHGAPRELRQAPTTPGRCSPGGNGEGAAPQRPPGREAPGAAGGAGLTTAMAGRCSPRVPLRQRGGSSAPSPAQPGAAPAPPPPPAAAPRSALTSAGRAPLLDTCPACPGQAHPAWRRRLAAGAPGPARPAERSAGAAPAGRERGDPVRGGPDGAGGAPSRGSLTPSRRGTPGAGTDRAAGAHWGLRPPPSRRCSLPGF